MRIVLTGVHGQVGWELASVLSGSGTLIPCDRSRLDLSAPTHIARCIDDLRPDVIINAAAYTAVDKAESEAALATAVNATAPAALAEAACRHGALLIHYSTDYVFDGRKPAPYVEADETCPLNAYGRSKRQGEIAIRDSGADHLIFRTSWVFSARGGNFLKTMLRLAAEREQLRVVSDQIGAPTAARLLAACTARALSQTILERREGRFRSGLYHLSASGHTSWHGFASSIIAGARSRGLRLKCRQIDAITTAEYPLPAARPANSRLDCSRFVRHFGLSLPDWQEDMGLCLDEVVSGR